MSSETELIKDRLDLAEIVGEYVALKKAGGHFKGLCPFHQEKTPSFIVSPAKGIWHCFGCQSGGDVISFVQRVEGLEFPAALKLLADRAGVTLAQRAEHGDARVRLFELLQTAARFYHAVLMHKQAGLQAREYLASRGVTNKSMEQFGIGYAPPAWEAVQQPLRRKGFRDEEMIAAGLVGKGERGLYDRFRGRIMFPVHDVQDRVVAFGGRIVPWHTTGSEGKYINSPETSVYSKRRTVYNLNRAKRVLRQQACLVVEGYLDVVMLTQAGFPGVVASSGTAFTPEQVGLLARYTNTLHFAFDADAAGVHAAQSATQEALTAGLRVAAVLFPAGQDPADVVQRDAAAVRDYLEKPISLVELLIERLRQTAGDNDREALLVGMLPVVANVANIVQQGAFVQDIAAALHVPESVVIDRLGSFRTLAPLEADTAAGGAESGRTTLSAEQLVLGLLLLDPELRQSVFTSLQETYFLDAACRNLYTQLQRLAAQAPDFMRLSPDNLIAELPADTTSLAEAVRQVAAHHREHSQDTVLHEGASLVRRLQRRQLERELRVLQQKLVGAPASERQRMLREFQHVVSELAATKAT